jgi:hypothetical protein
LQERFGEASYFFVNIDAITDFNRPISDKILYIGKYYLLIAKNNVFLGGLGNSGISDKPLEPVGYF